LEIIYSKLDANGRGAQPSLDVKREKNINWNIDLEARKDSRNRSGAVVRVLVIAAVVAKLF
jgi:hypothetical protein